MEVQLSSNNSQIFAPLKDKWLVNTPEERVRQEYICRLVRDYDFQLEQMAQETCISNSQHSKVREYADILIWRSVDDKLEENSPIIVIECKAENITVFERDYFPDINCTFSTGALFFVASNLKETRIYANLNFLQIIDL